MKRKVIPLFVACAMLLTSLHGFAPAVKAADETVRLGDYVTMGTYNGKPIKWRCVAFEKIAGYDEAGNPIMDSTDTVTEPTAGYLPLMLADNYVCVKEFDVCGADASSSHGRGEYRTVTYGNGGSNYWGDSNLRCWLNSDEETVTYTCGNAPTGSNLYQRGREPGFLTNFAVEDLARIKPVTQKTPVSKCDYDYLSAQDSTQVGGSTDFGSESKTWSKGMSFEDVLVGYDTAYYVLVTDTVFLPDLQQLKNVSNNGAALDDLNYYHTNHKGSDSSDRYTQSPGFIRSVGNFDNYVVTFDAYGKKFFSSPASYIDTTVRPAFYLNEMPAAEPEPTPSESVEPTPTPTETVEPTPAPTETTDPTPTPTETVEPTPAPTGTPDPAPTTSPEPSPSPSPAPTPTVKPTPTPDDDDDDDYTPPSKPSKPSSSSKAPKPKETPAPAPTPEQKEPVASVEQFTDVSEKTWYYEPVKYALEKGLMVGMTDTEFAPEAEITRAMFVTVLYRMAGEPELPDETLAETFGDVKADSWYEKAVYWAKLNGITLGSTPEEFAPHQGITREQMAVMVYRYAKLMEYGSEADTELAYDDQSGISSYAKEAVGWSTANGIMQGYKNNTFEPKTNTTRAQAAAIFERLAKNQE